MKDSYKITDHLSPADVLTVLTLVASDEQLARCIAKMSLARLSELAPEEVAAVLYDELDALEVEDVWDRAGQTRHGYVEPGEAADQVIEEVLEPFLEEMTKYQKPGVNTEANKMRIGVATGTTPI
jgi:hypothetical protein